MLGEQIRLILWIPIDQHIAEVAVHATGGRVTASGRRPLGTDLFRQWLKQFAMVVAIERAERLVDFNVLKRLDRLHRRNLVERSWIFLLVLLIPL